MRCDYTCAVAVRETSRPEAVSVWVNLLRCLTWRRWWWIVMVRSRSRSPPGARRDSRSPRRHRSSSNSPTRLKERRDDDKDHKDSKSGGPPKERQITEEDMEGKTEEEIEMMKIMGFGSFDTTKGKKVEGSVNAYAINVSQKRKYRQYMNRKGGFNRPLDFIA
ncbi:U4/U6.U5 small nuclear ribonucleoprotein 27 kDa protein [Microcaecilia unicolor]|uniref:U4/U6.U5 small nuclear ribonucleoprotein 27 kDa protein n=1 Tax=Microcaecilia unicolor TaxID=1415580 RepID=A0A6P7XZP9_9AMPH|nr:U4/U6.U5 small nuclear ribonucleoprotein 27 kDa protein [Microcaecilia unicolor]